MMMMVLLTWHLACGALVLADLWPLPDPDDPEAAWTRLIAWTVLGGAAWAVPVIVAADWWRAMTWRRSLK